MPCNQPAKVWRADCGSDTVAPFQKILICQGTRITMVPSAASAAARVALFLVGLWPFHLLTLFGRIDMQQTC